MSAMTQVLTPRDMTQSDEPRAQRKAQFGQGKRRARAASLRCVWTSQCDPGSTRLAEFTDVEGVLSRLGQLALDPDECS
jgi:hypothetical protein